MSIDEASPSIYCRECGYSLVGLSEPRCPECGRSFDPADAQTFANTPEGWRRRRWVPTAAATTAAIIALLALAGAMLAANLLLIPLMILSVGMSIAINGGIIAFCYWAWRRFGLTSAFWLGIYKLVGWGLFWQPYVLTRLINAKIGANPIGATWGDVLSSHHVLGQLCFLLAMGLLAGLLMSDFLFLVQQKGQRIEGPILDALLALRRRSGVLGGMIVILECLPGVALLNWLLS